MRNLKEERIGLIKQNSIGNYMQIIDYDTSNSITVQFLDDFKSIVKTTWRYFEKGQVTNPYGQYVCGVGIIGNKPPIRDETGKLSVEYRTWVNMLRRCYNNYGRDRDERYLDCSVTEEWFLFENFYHWMRNQENYLQWVILENKGLDKDIILKNNKIYSPDTCCLVPGYVNNLFTKHDKKRGRYCIGVSFHKRDKVFTATCHNPFTNKSDHLGYFQTEREAFYAYKLHKESIIKFVAEKEYRNHTISKECYNAMMVYEVEFED